jgi:hypothetical protein
VLSAHRSHRFIAAAVAVLCTAAVVAFGELSTGALLAVGGTGGLVVVAGVAGSAGDAAPPVGRRGLPWAGWLAAAVTWELLTLLDGDLPSVSDLADPVLSLPPVRGAATVVWLAAGAWLLTRPSRGPARP